MNSAFADKGKKSAKGGALSYSLCVLGDFHCMEFFNHTTPEPIHLWLYSEITKFPGISSISAGGLLYDARAAYYPKSKKWTSR